MLPLFAPGVDPGAVVRGPAPPGESRGGRHRSCRPTGTPFDITHATTVVAIRSADGVVMAGDRRATAGVAIANRRIEKVYAADEHSGVAIAGAAGPAVEMVRLFQVQLRHYEKVEGEQLSLEGKANQLAQMVRANLPAAMQGFVGRAALRRLRPPAPPGPRVLLRRHRRQVRRGRLHGQRLRRRPRQELDQGRLVRGHRLRRRGRTSRSARCSPPPTRTPPPAAPTSCAGSTRWSRSSTPTGSACSTTTTSPPAPQDLLGGAERGGNESREA